MKRALALVLALVFVLGLATVSLAEGKVPLTALFIAHPLTKSVEEMKWLKEIADDAGVEITWEQIYTDWDQLKTTRFASGDIPDILINATSIGFAPNILEKPDLDYDTVTDGLWVSDVVFNPVEPLFLKEAQAHGARTVSGIGMLVQQAALNFTLWTGKEAPVQVMYEALKKEFE
jgi:shikimate 5-dehydrogenase